MRKTLTFLQRFAVALMIAVGLALVSAILIQPAPAHAMGGVIQRRPTCAPRAQMMAVLANLHFDIRVRALAAAGYLFEIAVRDGDDWRVFATSPTGLTCMLDSGTGFDITPVALPGEAS